ncbi:hypothetical protein K439DRAFT_1363789, partial [Ramaria rubella]
KWLESLSDGECLWHFCMTVKQLIELASVLMLPWFITTANKSTFTGIKALALLLAWCRTAGDQFNLSVRYMRSQSAISGVMNWTVLYLDETWTHLLKWDHEGLLTPERLSHYADAIYTQGAPTGTVFSWPDCMKFHICRPSQFQCMACNGQE